MKALNLLKMLPRNQPQTSTVGFTMFELMVVVVIIGILSAIAVPGWNAFINNQRTRTVNDAVLRALRSAQSDAKLKKASRELQFRDVEDKEKDPNTDKPYNDPPRFIIYPDQEDNDDDIPNDDLRWQSLGANGEIKAGMVELATGKCANDDCSNGFITNTNTIIFNNQGVIEEEESLPFAVTTAIAEGKGAKRCIIVQTILGSMRTAEGEQCP